MLSDEHNATLDKASRNQLESSSVAGDLRIAIDAALSEIAALRAERERLAAVVEKVSRLPQSLPACVNGEFFYERHDFDGEYIGSEYVDPATVVQGLCQGIDEAVAALAAEAARAKGAKQ